MKVKKMPPNFLGEDWKQKLFYYPKYRFLGIGSDKKTTSFFKEKNCMLFVRMLRVNLLSSTSLTIKVSGSYLYPTKRSLKGAILHNGKLFDSIPVAHSVRIKKS